MKITPSNPFISIGLGIVGLSASLHAATTLTGSGLANNTLIPATHGSDSAGTPELDLNWTATVGTTGAANRWEAYNSWPNGGTGGQVYQLNGPNPWTGQTYSIAFTPELPTVAAKLTSVTLNDWVGPATNNSTTLNISIVGSVSGSLFSQTGVVVNNGTAPTFNFGALGTQGVGGETLTLTFAPTAGVGSYFAIDNLAFDQVVVPEPSSAVLGGLALGALALRRRRH